MTPTAVVTEFRSRYIRMMRGVKWQIGKWTVLDLVIQLDFFFLTPTLNFFPKVDMKKKMHFKLSIFKTHQNGSQACSGQL